MELSEGKGEPEEAREGMSPGLAGTFVPGVFPCSPPRPHTGHPSHQIWGWASGLSDPLFPQSFFTLGPALDQAPGLGDSSRHRETGGSQASHKRARAERGTHDVGAQGAEGRCAAGEQVGAVQRQEDLDVVLTVALGKEGRGGQAQARHQGAPPGPQHRRVRGVRGKLLLSGAPQTPAQMRIQQGPGAEQTGPRSVCAAGEPGGSASSALGKLLFSLGVKAQKPSPLGCLGPQRSFFGTSVKTSGPPHLPGEVSHSPEQDPGPQTHDRLCKGV